MPHPKQRQQQSDDDDYSNEDDQVDDQDKVMVKKPKVQRLDNMKNFKKIIINVSMTQYPVVIEVAEELGWKIQYSPDSGDWDVFWTDWHIEPDVLIKMHLFQKISHYPGIHTLARKNLLGMNLMNIRQAFPQQYNFFPLTWMLPQEYVEFRTYFQSKPKGKARTYIVKPQADCQGRGIFLTRKIQSIENGKHYVVQRYISRPFLVDGLKFDMRIYVLIGSVNPLRIYLFEDGLARFATQPYIEPTTSNLQKQYMHLTNYAINKKNPKFIFNNNAANMGTGHKRSLLCVMKQLQSKGVNIQQLREKIKDLIIKTVITGLPIMSHQYKCSQPEDYTGNMCFHILGFDVMLKNNAEPVLLEVNHTPSFTTDTPLDFKIKKALIKDTLKIMNVNLAKKTELYNLSMENNQARLLTGKRNILQGKERDQLIEKHQRERQQYEKNNLGGFEVIYPCKSQEKMVLYKTLIEHCNKQYFQQKGSVRMKVAQKQAKRLAREEYKQLKRKKQQKQKDKEKQSQRQNIVSSQTKSQNKQSTEQTIENNAIVKIKPIKKTSTPASSMDFHQQKKKTIDNSQISVNIEPSQRDKFQPPIVTYNRQMRTRSERIPSSSAKQHTQKTIQSFNRQDLPITQKPPSTPLRILSEKLSQLPIINDSPTELPNKSNLMIGLQYDRRRYIKGGSAINIDRNNIQRSISGKANSMNKNASTSVQQQKQDLTTRQNLSSLISRKRAEQKISASKKKVINVNNFKDLKQSDANKINYNGLYMSSNATGLTGYENAGEFVMPKIFCLNFQAEKNNIDPNLKFLMFRNFQNAQK